MANSNKKFIMAILKEKLESPEFYVLMQAYRHAPLSPQDAVIRAFEAVKEYLLKVDPADFDRDYDERD